MSSQVVTASPQLLPEVPAIASDRFRNLDQDRFDVVVVGAGTGGLTAAALLACRGRSVLVLDAQSVAGGSATLFHRPGYDFDVGLHTIPDCAPEGVIPRLLRAAGVRGVAFNEMDPAGFDTLVFPDFTFRVPKGIENFRARLIEQFPGEKRAIDRYLRMVQDVSSLRGIGDELWPAIRTLWRARRALFHPGSTLESFLDSLTENERLRAVLTAESAIYGEPPSRASLVVHAALTMAYLGGAYYPRGGGQALSDGLAESIERNGGKILLQATATRILVEDGRAVGVELESKHLGRRTVRAPVVISDADLKETLLELVGPTYLKPATVDRVRRYEMAPGFGVVYLGVRRDLRAAGVPRTNFWIHPTLDQEPVYAEARAGRFHPDPFCYVSIATLKDPDNPHRAPPGMTNMELMTIAPSQPEAWGTSAEDVAKGAYQKCSQYLSAKNQFARRLIRVAERVFPHLARDLIYQEVSTPLTHAQFTRATGGTGYGIALIPSQFLWRRPGHATEIKGLYLCGASTYTGHGILGVMLSGAVVASRVLGASVLARSQE